MHDLWRNADCDQSPKCKGFAAAASAYLVRDTSKSCPTGLSKFGFSCFPLKLTLLVYAAYGSRSSCFMRRVNAQRQHMVWLCQAFTSSFCGAPV